MTELQMIGIYHYLPEGERKLKKAFHKISPDIVLLEGSLTNVETQELYVQILRSEIERRGIDPELASAMLAEQELKGFEERAARAYCESRNLAPAEYLDDSFNNETENQIRQMIGSTLDGLIGHTPESAMDFLNSRLRALEAYYEGMCSIIGSPSEAEIVASRPGLQKRIGKRDGKMEAKTRIVVEENPEARIATVSGINHLLIHPNEDSFYQRVLDLEPRRMTL